MAEIRLNLRYILFLGLASFVFFYYILAGSLKTTLPDRYQPTKKNSLIVQRLRPNIDVQTENDQVGLISLIKDPQPRDGIYNRNSQSVTEKSIDPSDNKAIMYMEGWVDFEDFYNSDFNIYLDFHSEAKCGYKCTSSRTGEVRYSSVNVVVIQPSTLRLDPPKKHPHQYWILHAFEPLTGLQSENLHSNGYSPLIDHYMIQPADSLTPLSFLRRLNAFSSANIVPKSHPALCLSQLVSTCKPLTPGALGLTLGGELSSLSPGLSIIAVGVCTELSATLAVPSNSTFIILDETVCQRSLLEHFLMALRDERRFIPVVPRRERESDMRELYSVAPPNSFIYAGDYKDSSALLSHLQKVVYGNDLFSSYHTWREKYTLHTAAGQCLCNI